MSRDFRYRAESHRNRRRSVWPPFTAGLLIGLLGMGLAWVTLGSKDGGKLVGQCPEGRATQPDIAEEKAADKSPQEPVFDYPTILPTMEVIVPDEPAARGAPAAPAPPEVRKEVVQTTPPSSSGEVLMIQVAAVKALADAERLKAQLALSGLQAQIEPAKIRNMTVYRVRIGPFGSKEKLEGPRRTLTNAGYSSIIVRLK